MTESLTVSDVVGVTRRRALLGGLSAAAALTLPGCSGGSPPTAPSTTAPSTTASATGPAAPDYPGMPAAVEDYITKGSATLDAIRAVLVSVGGSTLVEHYRHGVDASTYLQIFSVTKSVTATLIGAAVADDLIGLDQTLNDLLPEHRRAMSAQTKATTLRQLMSMSAGLPEDPPEDEIARVKPENLLDLFLRLPLEDPPGTRFLYSNVSALVAGAALHAALGRAGEGNMLTYARKKLFDPMDIDTRPAYEGDGRPDGADQDAFRRPGFAWDRGGTEIHNGAFSMKLRGPDLIKFGELQRLGGVWKGQTLVGPDWVTTVTTPSALNSTYGLLWWLQASGGHPAYSARGFGGQLVVVVPETETVVVVLSADDAAVPITDGEELFGLVDDVLLAGT